jgi:hypothetical protein
MDAHQILKTRNGIVTTKKIIGAALAKMQQAFYDEETLQLYKNRNEENLYLEQFDCLKNDIISYTTFNKIIGLNHYDIDTFTQTVRNKLTELFEILHATHFIIIAHLRLDFFANSNNEFEPLMNAYQKLENIVGGSAYKEAFEIDMSSLPEFIEIMFWITRCNAGAPEYIFLFDEEEQIQINICKYGNVHLTEYNKEQITESKLKALGWTIIQEREFDNFSDDGKITGRKIKV